MENSQEKFTITYLLLSVINTTEIHKYNIDFSLKRNFISQHLHFIVPQAITTSIFKITRQQVSGCLWIKKKDSKFSYLVICISGNEG